MDILKRGLGSKYSKELCSKQPSSDWTTKIIYCRSQIYQMTSNVIRCQVDVLGPGVLILSKYVVHFKMRHQMHGYIWSVWCFNSESHWCDCICWVSSSWLRFCCPTRYELSTMTTFVSIIRFMQKSRLYPHSVFHRLSHLYLEWRPTIGPSVCILTSSFTLSTVHLHLDYQPTWEPLAHGSCPQPQPCVSSKTWPCHPSRGSGDGHHHGCYHFHNGHHYHHNHDKPRWWS